MGDIRAIRGVVARARRRLRLQAALEGATTAAIVAVVAALGILWTWRMELLSPSGASLALAGAGSLLLFGALIAAARRPSDAHVATRVDRASGLADRLGTALDFEGRVAGEPNLETQALMRAAIDESRIVAMSFCEPRS